MQLESISCQGPSARTTSDASSTQLKLGCQDSSRRFAPATQYFFTSSRSASEHVSESPAGSGSAGMEEEHLAVGVVSSSFQGEEGIGGTKTSQPWSVFGSPHPSANAKRERPAEATSEVPAETLESNSDTEDVTSRRSRALSPRSGAQRHT